MGCFAVGGHVWGQGDGDAVGDTSTGGYGGGVGGEALLKVGFAGGLVDCGYGMFVCVGFNN
jgi:hypothetical protein